MRKKKGTKYCKLYWDKDSHKSNKYNEEEYCTWTKHLLRKHNRVLFIVFCFQPAYLPDVESNLQYLL